MITYQEEPFEPFIKEAFPIFRQHYLEIAERPDVIKFNINFKAYYRLAKRNKLVIHSVREDGNLVGYNVWFLGRYLHAQDGISANSDNLFIRPRYRKGLFGYKFLKWSIEEIKKHNPQRILLHVKPSHDYGALLERLGAECYEKSYMIVVE
jgi:hypothetical protein